LIRPEINIDIRQIILDVFRDKGYTAAIDTMLTYLEEYASTNHISYLMMLDYYIRVGNIEKAIECYKKGYEMHDPAMPYYTLPFNGFDQIKNDPSIISIVEKMKLPYESTD
jgi:pentatricopeptide repeat protein